MRKPAHNRHPRSRARGPNHQLASFNDTTYRPIDTISPSESFGTAIAIHQARRVLISMDATHLEAEGGVMLHRAIRIGLAFALIFGAATSQIPNEWSTLGTPPRIPGTVKSMVEYDDGTGLALYAVGIVEARDSAGINRRVLVRFDGTEWRGVACPFEGMANVLLVHDDGSGPALYLGGAFKTPGSATLDIGVVRWNGQAWAAVMSGLVNTIHALCAYPPGSHDLYAGGTSGVRRWDGAQWTLLPSPLGTTYALLPFDTGNGMQLIAGGKFFQIPWGGGPPGWIIAHNIAAWNGQAWSPLGSGLTATWSFSEVQTLCGVTSGTLQGLYAGGRFTNSGPLIANNIARYANGSWSALGNGLTVQPGSTGGAAGVWEIQSHDFGGGSKLYVGGIFHDASGVSVKNIASWDGNGWADVDGGVATTIGYPTSYHGIVDAMTIANGGTQLVLGGLFNNIGSSGLSASSAAALTSGIWTNLGGGIRVDTTMTLGGFTVHPPDLATIDLDGTPQLLAISRTFTNGYLGLNAGFSEIDGIEAAGLAKFDGATWTSLSPGMPPRTDFDPRSITVWDDGTGETLFAFADRMLKWNGSTWVDIDPNPSGAFSITRLFTYEAGNGRKLYGMTVGLEIMEWTSSGWIVASTTQLPGASVNIKAIRELDLGNGPEIVMCGEAYNAVTYFPAPAGFVVRWRGNAFLDYTIMGRDYYDPELEQWGLEGSIDTVAAYDFGNGPELVVAGLLRESVGAVDVRRFDGMIWHWVGNAIGSAGSSIRLLSALDDGRGRALTAVMNGAIYYESQEIALCRFDGSDWISDPMGIVAADTAVTTFDDGGGEDLVISGKFSPPGVDVTSTVVFAHSCLDGRVGRWLGHPEQTLAIGPVGAPTTNRSVELSLGEPFAISVAQPSTTSFPANFILLGLIGQPDASTVVASPLGLSAMDLPGGAVPSFWITSNLVGAPQFFPSAPAPFVMTLPGLNWPFEVTIQGAILDASSPFGISLTNGIVVRFGV